MMAIPYVTKQGSDYQKLIADLLLEAGAWKRSEARISMRVLVCPRDSRIQDISNRLKILEDALKNGNLFVDDSQVDRIEIRRGPIVKGGCVRVTVWEEVPDYQANLRWVELVG